VIVGAGGPARQGEPRGVDQPASTVMPKNSACLAAATLVQTKAALIAAFMAKHFGGVVGHGVDRPTSTATARDHQSLVEATLAPCVMTNTTGHPGGPVTSPLPTQTTGNQQYLTAANLVRFNHDDAGVDVEKPLPTITQTNHAALVYSFLVRYFGTAIGQHCTEPLFTITGKDHFGLVTVMVKGELYVIVDIGMRMLSPRELARAQGFPDEYILTGSKSNRVARIGNSVCPVMAKVLVEANFVRETVKRKAVTA
jgi:DNA (cytosine-5)-methyltransferase 1